jgi:hypothetical protein
MLTNAAVLLALAAPITAPPAEPPAAAPPAEAVLDVLHFSGTGCAENMTAVAPSPDRQAVTVTYADFELFVGGPASATRACTVIVRVTQPDGWTSAYGRVDQRGYATLPEGGAAQVRVSYQSANSAPVRADTTLPVPFDDSWQTAHQVEDGKHRYGPCGGPHFVAVSTELRVDAPDGGSADASVYSTDFGTDNLLWKRC